MVNAEKSISEFDIKIRLQREYVVHFKNRLKWLFSSFLEKQKIKPKYINELKEKKFKVNRNIAYNFLFYDHLKYDIIIKIVWHDGRVVKAWASNTYGFTRISSNLVRAVFLDFFFM